MTEEARPSLLQVIQDTPGHRPRIIADCVVVLEGEVSRKKGIRGTAIKLVFKTVKALGRGILEELLDMLLDEFIEELDPFYQSYMDLDVSTRPSFERFLSQRSQEVSNALLNVTDKRRQRASNRALIKAYDKLRPTALNHVEEGVPAIGELIGRYAGV